MKKGIWTSENMENMVHFKCLRKVNPGKTDQELKYMKQ